MSLENTALNIERFGQSADERPLAIDLFCGLGGWTDGLLAEGWRFQKALIPALFLLSFFAVMILDKINTRIGAWAVLTFGFGWLAIVVWFGILQK